MTICPSCGYPCLMSPWIGFLLRESDFLIYHISVSPLCVWAYVLNLCVCFSFFPFFCCWLAACGWSYIGSFWQLNYFFVITLYQQQHISSSNLKESYFITRPPPSSVRHTPLYEKGTKQAQNKSFFQNPTSSNSGISVLL